MVGYELGVGSLNNHRQGRQQVEAKVSPRRCAGPSRGVQGKFVNELHGLFTKAAVRLKNKRRKLDAEGRYHGAVLRNLRLFSG